MVRHSKNQATSATGLLNFHYATPPSQQEPQRGGNSQQYGGNNSNNNNNRRNQQQYNRTAQDRASARRKANKAMFYLHSSGDHAFILSRQSPSKMDQTSYSFRGSDQPVSWESVRMVKQLVPLNINEEPTCPICLSDFTCARITKCGHVFCLPCVSRHSQSTAANNPYHHVKCPSVRSIFDLHAPYSCP
jgi:hypothetical protein